MNSLVPLFTFLVLFTANQNQEVFSFSAGVPPLPAICKSLTPRHGRYKPQVSEAPYQISVNPESVAGGKCVTVTLKSTGDMKFKGFYVQGRGENGKPIGTFTANKLTDVHSCGGVRWNAAHHASGKVEKDLVEIQWEAPWDYEGEVNFIGSFVHTYVTIWTGVYSNAVNVVKSNETIPLRFGLYRRPMRGNSTFFGNLRNIIALNAFRRGES